MGGRRLSLFVRLAQVHAPKGGVSIGGKKFKGGEFIPGEDLAKATPEEKAKIEGKGEESKKTNSEQNQTDSPQFKKWFGKSKIVDEKGEPLRIYHGTADEFVSFDINHPNRKDAGWLGTGVYMTTDPDLASSYSLMKVGSANVVPLFARLENPFHASIKDKQRIQVIEHNEGKEAARVVADEWTEMLISKGHDGVILDFSKTKFSQQSQEIVVFNPAGVKSATGNRGAFDPKNPDIRMSVA